MKSSCVTSLIESVPSILGKKSFLFTRRVKLSIFWTVRVHINSLIVKGWELFWSVKWGCKMALVSDKRDVDNWTFVWNKIILIYFMFQLSSGHICNYITAEYLPHAMQYRPFSCSGSVARFSRFFINFTIIISKFKIHIHIQLWLKDWTTELEFHTKSIRLTLKHDILRTTNWTT